MTQAYHDLPYFTLGYVAQLDLFNGDCFSCSPIQGSCTGAEEHDQVIPTVELTVDLPKRALAQRIAQLLRTRRVNYASYKPRSRHTYALSSLFEATCFGGEDMVASWFGGV